MFGFGKREYYEPGVHEQLLDITSPNFSVKPVWDLDEFHIIPSKQIALSEAHITTKDCFCDPREALYGFAEDYEVWRHRNISDDDAVNEELHRKEVEARVSARLAQEVEEEILEEKQRKDQLKSDAEFVHNLGLKDAWDVRKRLEEIEDEQEVLERYLDSHLWAFDGQIIY